MSAFKYAHLCSSLPKECCLHDFVSELCKSILLLNCWFRSTQSIGLLSYTFLRCTGKEDIVVPMVRNCIPSPVKKINIMYANFLLPRLKCDEFSTFSALGWKVNWNYWMDTAFCLLERDVSLKELLMDSVMS